MTDVAKAAGVSQSTVSMVLNQLPGARLSAATRSRVLDAAAALGYRLARPATPAAAIAAPGIAPAPARPWIGWRKASWPSRPDGLFLFLVQGYVPGDQADLHGQAARFHLDQSIHGAAVAATDEEPMRPRRHPLHPHRGNSHETSVQEDLGEAQSRR